MADQTVETMEGPPDLLPYVPRLVADWATEAAHQRWRVVDGSLLFVDVSGFTKLSERLARHGKVGAEEVVDVIGGCFTALLAVAYEGGGSLLKFGGDALLLLFTGPDHATRAAGAAVGMQRRLAQVGRLETSAGRVVLRMSAGVHSGEFGCFLVGDSHRELLLAGPAVTTTVAMESAASAGQVIVSHATAAALPGVLLGEPLGPGIRVRRTTSTRAEASPNTGRYPSRSSTSTEPTSSTNVRARPPFPRRSMSSSPTCNGRPTNAT
jgi:class 3 adenylate cyclase